MIVGLGNPGKKYFETRHNLGWMVLEHAARRWNVPFSDRLNASEASTTVGDVPVLLVRPLAWMNQTGPIVQTILEKHGLDPSDLVVIHDDLDLPFGTIRIKTCGGAGGHNGLWSILEQVGTDQFCRLKIGIGRPHNGVEAADYVLSPFFSEEQGRLQDVLEKVVDALECLIQNGPSATMNQFHQQHREGS